MALPSLGGGTPVDIYLRLIFTAEVVNSYGTTVVGGRNPRRYLPTVESYGEGRNPRGTPAEPPRNPPI